MHVQGGDILLMKLTRARRVIRGSARGGWGDRTGWAWQANLSGWVETRGGRDTAVLLALLPLSYESDRSPLAQAPLLLLLLLLLEEGRRGQDDGKEGGVCRWQMKQSPSRLTVFTHLSGVAHATLVSLFATLALSLLCRPIPPLQLPGFNRRKPSSLDAFLVTLQQILDF